MEYDYPLNYSWSTEEILQVIALFNAVEKAYEEGLSSADFKEVYRVFKTIVDSKSEEKQLDKEFLEQSGYSIYQVVKKASQNDWIKM